MFVLARDDSRYLRPQINLGRVAADLFDFARYGIPGQLVSDNGSQFMSRYFLKFAKKRDFEHLTSSPHHNKSENLQEVQSRWIRCLSCLALPS